MNFLAWLPNRLAIEMELNVGTIEPFLILQDRDGGKVGAQDACAAPVFGRETQRVL